MTQAAAAKFPLPEKALSMHTILLAKTRAGKSSTLRLIAEHGMDQKIPTCIIDPKGDWWGIKSSATGKAAGYPVVIFGGEHADVPINEHAGAHVAELVATGNRPALIDLGGWMPAPRTRFFLDFAAAFFLKTRGRRWLMIDECHNFAPQGKVLDPDSGKMLHWANRLVNEGGGKGVTVFSASQRPQKVHKDYATAHDTLIALRCVHPLDREAVKDWMSGYDPAKAKEIVASLPDLERGEAWCWSPEAKWGPKRLQFPKFSTFDSFAAPIGDEHVTKLKGWASVDLDEVKTKLAAVVEEARANDPKALKAELAKLRREVEAAKKHPAAPAASGPALTEAQLQKMIDDAYREGARSRDADVAESFTAGADAMLEQLQKGATAARAKLAPPRPKAIAPPPVRVLTPPRPAPQPVAAQARGAAPGRAPPPVAPRQAPGGDAITPYQLNLLGALAFWESIDIDAPSRAMIAAAAGVSVASSTFEKYLSSLRGAGLIDFPNQGRVSLTEAGRALAPSPDHRQSVRDALRRVLTPYQETLLDALPRDGSAMSRDDLAAAANVSVGSSTFEKYLSNLRSFGLINFPAARMVAVEAWVWS